MKIHFEANIKALISEMLNWLFISERSENYMPRQYSFIISFPRGDMAVVCLSLHSVHGVFGLFSDSAHKSLNKFIYTLFLSETENKKRKTKIITFSTKNILCFVVLFVDKIMYKCFMIILYVDFRRFEGARMEKAKWLRKTFLRALPRPHTSRSCIYV